MDYKDLFGIIAVIISFVGYAPYLREWGLCYLIGLAAFSYSSASDKG